jgi:hypothetical protein
MPENINHTEQVALAPLIRAKAAYSAQKSINIKAPAIAVRLLFPPTPFPHLEK